jgi:hydrogenase/urease accessory protein HupE
MKRSVLLLAALLVAASARAHDPGLSTLELRLDGDDLVVREIFVAMELEGNNAPRDWKPIAREALQVRLDDRPVRPEGVETQVGEEGEARFVMLFSRGGARQLRLRSTLVPRLGSNHRQYVTLVNEAGTLLTNKLLSASDAEFTATLPATATPAPETPPAPATSAAATVRFASFFRLGVEHILTGYDHLLFLFGLLIVGAGFWPAVRIITSFTLAHSITLALATFHVVSLPSRVVEPLIAATIVYVGVENLWRRDLKHRWALTFFFGLVHGLGFASVLRQLGVGETTGIAGPLVAFNLGVESGQIAVAAVVLPVIWRLSRWPKYATRLAPACSVFVAALGAYWLLQRAVPP